MEIPDPDALLREEEEEKSNGLLQDYFLVMHKLRYEKKFSYREIAEWLSARGVIVDHNAVYRALAKAEATKAAKGLPSHG